MSDMPSTIPADLAATIAGHLELFRGFSMLADGDTPPADGEKPVGGEPPVEAKKSEFVDDETGEKYGFPAKTPLSEMSGDEKAEYWRHKARKHESENKQLRQAKSGDGAKGKADESKDGVDPAKVREEAEAEARNRYAPMAVKAEFKAAFGDRRTSAQVDAILKTLDLSKFLTLKGDVDTDMVIQTADALAPKGSSAGSSSPDMGQGKRGAGHVSKAEQGRLEAERRFGKKS